MKKSRIRKITVTILAFVLVFAFASTAFAEVSGVLNMDIKGGPSRRVALLNRDRGDGVRFVVSLLLKNGQEGFKYRGWHDNETCSELKPVTAIGTFTAIYNGDEDLPDGDVKVMASIASTSTTDKLHFVGRVEC